MNKTTYSLGTVLGIAILAIVLGWYGKNAIAILFSRTAIATATLSAPYQVVWRGPWASPQVENKLVFSLTKAELLPYNDGQKTDKTKHLLILSVKIKNEDTASGLPTLHNARLVVNEEGDLQAPLLEAIPTNNDNFVNPNETVFDKEITFVVPADQTEFIINGGFPPVSFKIAYVDKQLLVSPISQ